MGEVERGCSSSWTAAPPGRMSTGELSRPWRDHCLEMFTGEPSRDHRRDGEVGASTEVPVEEVLVPWVTLCSDPSPQLPWPAAPTARGERPHLSPLRPHHLSRLRPHRCRPHHMPRHRRPRSLRTRLARAHVKQLRESSAGRRGGGADGVSRLTRSAERLPQ
eukprot:scaffold93016_cov66-Phaeocystis_antarctica.AAC.7